MSATSDMLPLPGAERIQLAHAPLALALCQVQFSPQFSVADPVVVGRFQQAIQDRYPIASQSQSLQVQVGGPEVGVRQSVSNQWEFTDREQVWKVVLAQSFLSLETRSYTDFSDFLLRLRSLLTALITHIQPTVGVRLGLRYVNEIRGDIGSWTDAISRELLGPLAVPMFHANTTQTSGLQQVLLQYPNHKGVTIVHGVIPSGATVRPRAGAPEPEGEFYLLDCDVYQEFPIPAGLRMEPEPICRLVEDYHHVAYRFFRWSLTDAYLASLREE